jgi:DNA-binding transcriptional LysR family regulator
MTIEIRLIRHALAVGQHGNFARAAEAMQITQPSLSRSIASLEALLGVPLFDRGAKGVTPTAFGRVLLDCGDTVLQREAHLRREIGLLAGLEQGSLKIGAGPFMAESSVARATARVAQLHPRLHVECVAADPADVLHDVLAERFDVGVAAATGLADDQRLVVETFAPMRIYFACRPGHPLTRERSPSLARGLDFPLVAMVLRAEHALLAATHGGTAPPRGLQAGHFVPQIKVNSMTTARLIACESDALVPGTAAMLADDVAAGRLVRLDMDAPTMRTDAGVFHLRGRSLSPAARVFIEHLRAVEAEAVAADAAMPAARPRPRMVNARR